ncbi:MAG: DUF3791 domain-containing protein [Defluviitaleaceae bacterium]|nr:DUF3791 domain-containing protein [Defluviitaleaceae bacterium]
MNKKELDFLVFCIEGVASALNISGDSVYSYLTSKSKILDEYILPHYDALHTQGKDYIVEDIIEQMKSEGLPI